VADAAFIKVSHALYNAGVDPIVFQSNSQPRWKLNYLGQMLVSPPFGGAGPIALNINYAVTIAKNATFGGVVVSSVQTGTTGTFFTADDAGTTVFYVGYGGGIYSTSASIGVISDVTFKEDITELPYGLDEIMQLRPVMYRLKTETAEHPPHYGFTAQEVQPIFPELVHTSEQFAKEGEEPPLVLMESSILIPLVKAVQELEARVRALEAA
jgi:hypothetical protein